jgi:ribosomal subunit interface protein
MDIVMTGRNIDVPAHYRVHVIDKLAHLQRYNSHVIRYEVELDHDNNPRQSKTCERVEITSTGNGPTMRAEACGPNFYTALDAASPSWRPGCGAATTAAGYTTADTSPPQSPPPPPPSPPRSAPIPTPPSTSPRTRPGDGNSSHLALIHKVHQTRDEGNRCQRVDEVPRRAATASSAARPDGRAGSDHHTQVGNEPADILRSQHPVAVATVRAPTVRPGTQRVSLMHAVDHTTAAATPSVGVTYVALRVHRRLCTC